jgi:Arc/MetJ-type ribon-helix-helix transcriptional regulator
MRKTSVYLSDAEIEGLRREANATGRSQSELIREGIRLVLSKGVVQERRFHSLGNGSGSGAPFSHWDPDDLYRKAMGRE